MEDELNRKAGKWIIYGLIAVFSLAFIVALSFSVYYLLKNTEKESLSIVTEEDDEWGDDIEEPELDEDEVTKKIDFQNLVDDWSASINGYNSVLIYDLDLQELVGVNNPDEYYNIASLYKLFVVYEGYRRVQNGTLDPDEEAGYTGYTILECLDLSIRESYSECAESIFAMIGHEELNEIIAGDFNITETDVSSLISTPADILKIMKLFYEHPDFYDVDLVAKMKDSFLNQPATIYDWRQGLPSGFSDNVSVYNKVGWNYDEDAGYWDVYHDAAIVEFPEENRHYIVIVMTNMVSFTKIRDFGTSIEEFFYENYNLPSAE